MSEALPSSFRQISVPTRAAAGCSPFPQCTNTHTHANVRHANARLSASAAGVLTRSSWRTHVKVWSRKVKSSFMHFEPEADAAAAGHASMYTHQCTRIARKDAAAVTCYTLDYVTYVLCMHSSNQEQYL